MSDKLYRIDVVLDPPPVLINGAKDRCSDYVHITAESQDLNALAWFLDFVRDRTATEFEMEEIQVEETK